MLVEKVALFCNPASGARSQALKLRCIDGYITAVAKAKVFPVFPHLDSGLGSGIKAWESRQKAGTPVSV